MTKVGDVAIAVTLATIATSEPGPPVSSGSPSTPATPMLSAWPPTTAPIGQLGAPFRVSQTRAGDASGVNCVPVDMLNQPSMSTAILTDPTLFQIETEQFPPLHVTGTITRLGSVLRAGTLRFDAFGRPVAAAKAVSTVATVGLIAVRLKTTAVTPDPGTGLPTPLTANVSVLTGPIGDNPPVSQRLGETPPTAARVSQMRSGVVGMYKPVDVVAT